MIFVSIKKQLWIVFRHLAEEFRNLSKKIHQRCQTEVYVSTSTSYNIWTIQVGSLRVQRNIWAENSVTNQKFLPFGQGGKMRRFLGEAVLADLSKHQSMCTGKHFETKGFFSKKKQNFDSVCWFGTEKFRKLANVFDIAVKTEIYVTSRRFWKKNFGRRFNFI